MVPVTWRACPSMHNLRECSSSIQVVGKMHSDQGNQKCNMSARPSTCNLLKSFKHFSSWTTHGIGLKRVCATHQENLFTLAKEVQRCNVPFPRSCGGQTHRHTHRHRHTNTQTYIHRHRHTNTQTHTHTPTQYAHQYKRFWSLSC